MFEFTHISSPAAVGPTIQPDRQYLRVWLRSARFAEVRRWATKFHASVHTRFEFVSRAQPQREVVCVVATDKAFSDTAAPDPHPHSVRSLGRSGAGPV